MLLFFYQNYLFRRSVVSELDAHLAINAPGLYVILKIYTPQSRHSAFGKAKRGTRQQPGDGRTRRDAPAEDGTA